MSPDSQLPSEITQLLKRWSAGDQKAFQEVFTLTWHDLHAIATGYLQRRGSNGTLQATALVNELYIKLAQVRGAALNDRRHFYTFSAQLMRMILIDHVRRSQAQKRPGAVMRVPLHDEMAWIDAAGEDLISLNGALDELEELDERKVRVIELRFFLGCTNEETADLLDVSRATVDRDLDFAKAWLYRRLSGELPAA
jgi:RNA polymerase sigma factor (TIGR02999 family)